MICLQFPVSHREYSVSLHPCGVTIKESLIQKNRFVLNHYILTINPILEPTWPHRSYGAGADGDRRARRRGCSCGRRPAGVGPGAGLRLDTPASDPPTVSAASAAGWTRARRTSGPAETLGGDDQGPSGMSTGSEKPGRSLPARKVRDVTTLVPRHPLEQTRPRGCQWSIWQPAGATNGPL